MGYARKWGLSKVNQGNDPDTEYSHPKGEPTRTPEPSGETIEEVIPTKPERAMPEEVKPESPEVRRYGTGKPYRIIITAEIINDSSRKKAP